MGLGAEPVCAQILALTLLTSCVACVTVGTDPYMAKWDPYIFPRRTETSVGILK